MGLKLLRGNSVGSTLQTTKSSPDKATLTISRKLEEWKTFPPEVKAFLLDQELAVTRAGLLELTSRARAILSAKATIKYRQKRERSNAS